MVGAIRRRAQRRLGEDGEDVGDASSRQISRHVDALFAKVVAAARFTDSSSPISPASSISHSLKARDTRTAPLRNSAARRALRRSDFCCAATGDVARALW